jgi:arsenite methyltransferase
MLLHHLSINLNGNSSSNINRERGVAAKSRMFNKQASDPKSKPDEILKVLALQPGQKVVDIGAGGGYFSIRFGEAVNGEGHVYAVDTDSGKADFIKKSAAEKGLGNIEVVLVEKDELSLPEKVDLIFLRNVYHHIPNRVKYFTKLKESLKPGARLVIVEHKGDGGIHRFFEHRVTGETIIQEMTQAGYRVTESLDILPKQTFTIFQ